MSVELLRAESYILPPPSGAMEQIIPDNNNNNSPNTNSNNMIKDSQFSKNDSSIMKNKSMSMVASAFVTGLNALNKSKFNDNNKITEIQTYYGKIQEILQVLDQKIGNLLRQHENDFIYAYKDQMFNVQKELKALKKKIDEETLKRRSDEKMNILEEERDWFRAEALRLDKICKEQQKTVNELKFKLKIVNEDKTYYEGYILEAKKENKALKEEILHLDGRKTPNEDLELRRSASMKKINRNQSEEKRNSTTRERKNGPNTLQTNEYIPSDHDNQGLSPPDMQTNFQGLNEGILPDQLKGTNYQVNEEKYIEMINELKYELEKERKIIKQLKSQKANMMINRSELEQILIDCINDIKKDISRRRSMLSLRELNKVPTLPEEINFSKFSSTDKKRVIEYFLSNEYVLEELYNIVFGQVRHGGMMMNNYQQQNPQQYMSNNSSINGDNKQGNGIKKSQSVSKISGPEIKMKYTFNYGFGDYSHKSSRRELGTSSSNGFSNKKRIL